MIKDPLELKTHRKKLFRQLVNESMFINSMSSYNLISITEEIVSDFYDEAELLHDNFMNQHVELDN